MYLKMYRNLVFIVLLISGMGYGQSFVTSDSLKNKSYEELRNEYFKSRKEDTLKTKEYARIYLRKAKESNDTIKTAEGFLLLSRISDQYSQLKYCDSAINITRYLNHRKYPALGYFRKGIYCFYNKDFKKSLDLHLKAYNYAKINNPDLTFEINYNIGILRVRQGDHKKALEVFKDSFKFAVENDYKNNDKISYLKMMFSLSNEYRRNHLSDSAEYYCNLGVKESKKYDNNSIKFEFLMTRAILDYDKKRYDRAIPNILKSKEFYETNRGNDPNLAFAYFYYAKILLGQNKTSKAVINFKKMDSIFQLNKDLHPELRSGYENLIDYYKIQSDKNNQLKYVERLIKVDSIINTNYKYLSKNITKEYDIPKLLEEKQKLIAALEKENKNISSKNIIISLLLGLSLLGLRYYYYRQRLFKK